MLFAVDEVFKALADPSRRKLLDELHKKLKNAGGHFRNDIVTGNGGKQILIEDPSRNPIEYFSPFSQPLDPRSKQEQRC